MKIYPMIVVVTVLAIAAAAVGAELTVRVYPAPPDFAGAHFRSKVDEAFDPFSCPGSGRAGDDADSAVRLVENTLADIGATKALTMGVESGDGRNARIEVSVDMVAEAAMPQEFKDETGEIVKMIEPLLPE